MFLLLFFFLQEPIDILKKDPKAIWIPLDHPRIDLPLTNLETGKKTNFQEKGFDGFTMILSSECGVCGKAYSLLSILERDYPTTVLFAGREPSIKAFLQEQGAVDLSRVYMINPKDLVPYNIRTVPTVLGYRENKLTMAFYGPIDENDAIQLIDLHENRSRVKKKN